MTPHDDISTFDELRAWSQGSMPAVDRARFEAELSRDPVRARSAEEFRAVWNATASGLGPAPVSHTTFDDLLVHGADADSPRETRWRRVAAAILIVAAVPAVWLVWKHNVSTARDLVVLHSIPLEVASVSEAAEHRVPALLANWSPVENGAIRWLDSMDDARAVSAAVGRPIFVYGFVDDCPICMGFQRKEFKDPEILALIDRSVPVKIDLMQLDGDALKAIMARRYPLLEVQDDRGDIVRTFPGQFADVDMRAELSGVLAHVVGPSWSIVRELTLALTSARAAAERGTWGEAATAFESLARRRDLPAFAAAGDEGLARLAAAASRTLGDARAGAQSDARRALATFEIDAARFQGTLFEPDLRTVLDVWRATGRFPNLEVQR